MTTTTTTPLIPSLISGLTFGAALAAASVSPASVIINQLRLTDFHMLLSFLSASACSALIIAIANYSGHVTLGPRKDSSYGWFMRYDANVIGGALIGLGMALTGTCPGTVLVQIAQGRERSWWVGAGNVVGGVVFVGWGSLLRSKQTGDDKAGKELESEREYTVMQKTGLSIKSTVLLYEGMCLAMMLGAAFLPRSQHWMNPVVGGLWIGGAQLLSVLLVKKSLGVSGAYEHLGKTFWSLLGKEKTFDMGSIVFAAGIMAGAKLISPHLPLDDLDTVVISTPAAFLGGCSMIFGARLAGGCTSGHGISGMSTMSFSSFITVAAMFAGGILAALVV